MSRATDETTTNHILYMGMLMRKIEQCHGEYVKDKANETDIHPSRNSGTLKNLSPELSKAASKLKRMMEGDFQ